MVLTEGFEVVVSSVGYARGAKEKSSLSGKVKPMFLNIAIVNMR
jgi:hypothetical protein